MLPIKNKCTSEIICKNNIRKDLKWISQICLCILPVNICSVGSSKGIFWLRFDIPLVILQLFFYIHLRAISAILDNALVRISWLSTKPFQTFDLVCFWTDLIKTGHSQKFYTVCLIFLAAELFTINEPDFSCFSSFC